MVRSGDFKFLSGGKHTVSVLMPGCGWLGRLVGAKQEQELSIRVKYVGIAN